MYQTLLVIWLVWLSSSVSEISARGKVDARSSRLDLAEGNDVRKLAVSSSGDSANGTVSDRPSKTNSTDDEEEKKTLAQQVADGKYGLIQTEIFDKPSKRPGIISYDVNPEVPKDNINNFGGLQADEIWLAENHLLVLKGGSFTENETETASWKPIDNFVAPKRPVKIPAKPKVAPPFPVQLKEGGPIEFIQGEKGGGGFRPFGPPPLPPPDVKNNLSLPPALSYPFPPFGLPPPPPFPFPGNLTDIDEDDPRFYYPPPYDFVYDRDNLSLVAPGPLVPGIVLPPPVDFFAPLDKTTAQKGKRPTDIEKNKYNHINTYAPKNKAKPAAFDLPTATPATKLKEKEVKSPVDRKQKEGRKHDGTRLVVTTPHTITRPLDVTRLVTRPPESTTVYVRVVSRPSLTTSTPIPRINPPKVSTGEWVPIINGPSVCPSSDPNCLDSPVKHGIRYTPVPSLYNSTEKHLQFITESPKDNAVNINNDFYPISGPRPNYFTTTASPYYDLKPIIVPTTVSTASYKGEQQNNYDPGETYYIYEEPIVPGTKVLLRDYDTPEIRNGPTIVYVNHDVRPKYELNTVSPLQDLGEQTGKKNTAKVKSKPSPLELFENELSTITNSNKFSITYTVGGRRPDVQIDGYSFNDPLDDPFDNIIKNHRNNYKNKKGRSKEIKTPIFEYSFSAPGYGQGDSPKISSIIPSTEKPETDPSQHQYSFFGFDSRPGVPGDTYPDSDTRSPVEFTTKKPKYRKVILNHLNDYLPTESPYTQIYTQQEPEYLDDITKNYFTLFGKKINGETYKYITTPLPPTVQEDKNYYDEVKTRQRTPKGPSRQNIRFPEEAAALQNVKNQNGDYGSGVDVSPSHGSSQVNNYNNRYYNNYRPKYYPRDYSLASDINVNYRKPYPPINPDAEYIDPAYLHREHDNPSNSYISYRLPGNGGHFYFLTPQNIHATNYHLASSGVRFPQGYNNNRLYYKRNAQTPRNRRWASSQ